MLESNIIINNETVTSFLELVMAAHTLTTSNGDMAATVAENDSDSTDYKPHPPLKPVAKLPSDMKSDIKCALADLGVVTKIDVKVIGQNRLSRRTNTLWSQTVKTVEYTFGDTLPASYFNTNNGLKSTSIKVVEQSLGEVARSSFAPAVSKAEMPTLAQTKLVAYKVFRSLLCNTGILVPIAGTVAKILKRAVDEYNLNGIEESLKTTTKDKL